MSRSIGREIESLERSRFEVNPAAATAAGISFSEGGPKTRFAVIRRRG